ncbi:hypothetical protein RAB80_018033 [Fusarium oxysporum f. sp. vasinfectum]|nr:hypothetical protein RAB80_018033 [Fusarium oxysporum f. sp. vasinfectum]
MSILLHYAVALVLWTIRGSQGQNLFEPTQQSYVTGHDRPPAQTKMMEIPKSRLLAKRQTTSSPNDVLTVTIAPDETCGWLSGRPGIPITCENHQPCMWMSSIALICGGLKEFDKWEYHLKCYEREATLNTDICNDICVSGHTLRCTEDSAAYCRTYAYPDGIHDYRCVPTPETRVSSVSFTYGAQKNAGLVTATYSNSDPRIVSTELVDSATLPSSSFAPQPSSQSPSAPPLSNHNIGAIIGGAIGGFVALSLVALAIFWFVRRSKKDDTSPIPRLRLPTQVAPMEQAQLTGTAPIDPNAGKTGPDSPVQSEWRSPTTTIPSSASDPALPQGWVNQQGSPMVQSTASQGVPQPVPQHIAYEMSGDPAQPQTQEIVGHPTRPRVYEMVGDSAHPYI